MAQALSLPSRDSSRLKSASPSSGPWEAIGCTSRPICRPGPLIPVTFKLCGNKKLPNEPNFPKHVGINGLAANPRIPLARRGQYLLQPFRHNHGATARQPRGASSQLAESRLLSTQVREPFPESGNRLQLNIRASGKASHPCPAETAQKTTKRTQFRRTVLLSITCATFAIACRRARRVPQPAAFSAHAEYWR